MSFWSLVSVLARVFRNRIDSVDTIDSTSNNDRITMRATTDVVRVYAVRPASRSCLRTSGLKARDTRREKGVRARFVTYDASKSKTVAVIR